MVTYSVPVQTKKADSLGWNVFATRPSSKLPPVVEIVIVPEPLFLNSVNQLLPSEVAKGKVDVPEPLDHTLVWARSPAR